VAPELLGSIDLSGVVVTGDALYAQRGLARQIVGAGGEYLFVVKDNQPTLREDIATLFADPPVEPAVVVQHNRRGGRQEVRRLEASTALSEYSDWPHLAQLCRIEREVTRKGETTREVAYVVSSLCPTRRDLGGCWNSTAATGGSRTGCTTCGTSPWAKMPAKFEREQHRG